MNSGLLVVLAIAAVGVVAFLMKRGSGDESVSAPGPRDRRSDEGAYEGTEAAEAPDDESGLPAEALAITSDGLAFMPRAHGVKVLPAADAREAYRSLHGRRSPAVQRPELGTPSEYDDTPLPRGASYELSAGDFVAARIRRGAPDVDPWRLEGLGREHELLVWSFETEEAARTAFALIEQRVVRPRKDSDGEPIPVGAEDWLVAEKNLLETAEALAMDDDEEPGDPEQRR